MLSNPNGIAPRYRDHRLADPQTLGSREWQEMRRGSKLTWMIHGIAMISGVRVTVKKQSDGEKEES
jgi:hypothetical protein